MTYRILFFLILLNGSLINIKAMRGVDVPSEEEQARAQAYRSHMLTSININEVEFYSHELVFLAQTVVQGKKCKKPFKIEMKEYEGQELSSIPKYKTYDEQVERRFSDFTDQLLGAAETQYQISSQDLQFIMELFYKIGPNYVITKYFSLWSSIMDKLKKVVDKSQGLVPGHSHDDILPVQLLPDLGAPAPRSWLGLTRYTKNANEPIKGWWLNIGDRLILLRNLPGDRKHFYVSDHGYTEDVVRDTKDAFLSFDKQGREKACRSFFFINRFFNQLKDEDKENLKARFFLLKLGKEKTAAIQDEILLYELISEGEGSQWVKPITEKERAMLNSLTVEQSNAFEENFKRAHEIIRYISTQAEEYVKSEGNQGGGLSPYFTQIDQIFHPDDSERYKNHFILKELAKKHGKGLQEYLFRPVHTFGMADEGGSYREFADAFKKYLASEGSVSENAIAVEMRNILRGEKLSSPELYFIPNLIAAWFVSEASRYENNHLFGLMMLDLIESGVVHYDSEGNNLHQWVHALVHPLKPEDSRVNLRVHDLYGQEEELARMDGFHPMAHGAGTVKKGSVKQSQQPLTNSQNLTPVHQKEGHILISWLAQFIGTRENQVSVVVSSNALMSKPNYDEMSKILSSARKPSKSISKDARLEKKWHITHSILIPSFKRRLATLDNLIPNEVEVKYKIEDGSIRSAIASLEKRFDCIFKNSNQNWQENPETKPALTRLLRLEKILYQETHPIIPWVTEILLELVEG